MHGKRISENTMSKVVTMFINGEKIKDIEEKCHVSHGAIVKKLNDLTCRHPLCTQGHPCRAAKRRYGGTMMCTALEDTDFENGFCPFFKTEDDYRHEYRKTNRLKPDPYELYTREIEVEEDWL